MIKELLPFDPEFRGEDGSEQKRRKELHAEIMRRVGELGDAYPNKSSYEHLIQPNPILPEIETKDVEELAEALRMINNNEELYKFLDTWIIEHENIITFLDSMFALPSRNPTEEQIETANATAKENYVSKMKRAMGILGKYFAVDKLNDLYQKTEGGLDFDAKLSELEHSLEGLSDAKKKKKTKDFFASIK